MLSLSLIHRVNAAPPTPHSGLLLSRPASSLPVGGDLTGGVLMGGPATTRLLVRSHLLRTTPRILHLGKAAHFISLAQVATSSKKPFPVCSLFSLELRGHPRAAEGLK